MGYLKVGPFRHFVLPYIDTYYRWDQTESPAQLSRYNIKQNSEHRNVPPESRTVTLKRSLPATFPCKTTTILNLLLPTTLLWLLLCCFMFP